MEEYVTATEWRMALSRYTRHALRDRYADTGIHEWGYTEQQLLQQGSWQDAEIVRLRQLVAELTPPQWADDTPVPDADAADKAHARLQATADSHETLTVKWGVQYAEMIRNGQEAQRLASKIQAERNDRLGVRSLPNNGQEAQQ